MDPVFKLLCRDRVSDLFDINDFSFVFKMGDRSIVFRAATGEQGEKGPFPYVQLLEGEESKAAYCMTNESQFEYLWRFLEAGCR